MRAIRNFFKLWRMKHFRAWRDGYKIDRTTRVHPKALIVTESRHDIEFGPKTKVHAFAHVASHGGRITIGSYCTINTFAVINGHGGLTIGDHVRIASHAVIIPADHNFSRRDIPIRRQGSTKRGVAIGDDVWLGTHAVVLDGVTVADGCVIAAGAVVTRSTEPYGVYAGVPARRIRDR